MLKLHRFCGFVVAVLAASMAVAQPGTGTLKGVLTDNSGAVIPAAVVSVAGTGVQKAARPGADGSYCVVGLAPGQYTVRVAFPGFGVFEKAVSVDAGGT